MAHYTLNQIERVRELAESGMTRADIRLQTGIGFWDLDRIALLHKITFRRGVSAIARETQGAPLTVKIRSVFERHPDARLSFTDVIHTAGIKNNAGMSAEVQSAIDSLVTDGFLKAEKGPRQNVAIYFRASVPAPAKPSETQSMAGDFQRCDDLAGIRQALADILAELRTLNGKEASRG